MTATEHSTCPRCGAGFNCGMVSGDSECWCFALPHSVAVPVQDSSEKTRCLCRVCLQKLMDSHDLPAATD